MELKKKNKQIIQRPTTKYPHLMVFHHKKPVYNNNKNIMKKHKQTLDFRIWWFQSFLRDRPKGHIDTEK